MSSYEKRALNNCKLVVGVVAVAVVVVVVVVVVDTERVIGG